MAAHRHRRRAFLISRRHSAHADSVKFRGILTERDSIDAQQTFSSLGALSTDEHEAVRTRPCGSSAPARY
jgi:hypothetical protein